MHARLPRGASAVELNMCPCGSCKKTSDLKLKFVAHVGEVATQTIKRRKKLVGLDVIHVHRMLKNPVEVPEYLLVTDELFRDVAPTSSGLAMHEIDLDLEGIGRVQTHYVDVGDLRRSRCPIPPGRSASARTFAMVGRGPPYAVSGTRRRALGSVG